MSIMLSETQLNVAGGFITICQGFVPSVCVCVCVVCTVCKCFNVNTQGVPTGVNHQGQGYQ